jgi:formate hydrogenlyase subunit 4
MGQDLLMILFAHAFSTVSLVVGGMSVRSPYSRIGSQRKIMQMLAYEPILVLLVVGIYCITGSFQSGAVWVVDRPLLLSLPLVFLAYLAALQVKLEKSPFDVATSHHAHQELVKGLTIEYSGPYLALVEITQFYEISLVVAIVAMFWSTNLVIGAGLALASFFLAILADNLTARVTTVRMVRYFWTVPLALAITNIIWLYAVRGGAR